MALAALAAASGASAVFAGGLVGWLPAMLLVALLLACIAYLAAVPRFLSFNAMGMQQECTRGEDAIMRLALSNSSLLPVFKGEACIYVTDIFGEIGSTFDVPFVMGARNNFKLESTTHFDHVGTYEAGVKSLRIFDPVGLFWRNVTVQCSCQVRVMPRIHQIDELNIDTQAASESNTALMPVPNEGMDYSGVREYVYGDPMKLVHWKLSARAQSSYTRLFEAYTNPGIAIMLDFRFPDYPHEVIADLNDALVETAFSLAICAQRRGLDVELRFEDKDRQPFAVSELATENIAQVTSYLPKPKPALADAKYLEDLESQIENRYAKSNIALCTATISHELCELLIQAKERGKHPVLYAAVPLAADERDRTEYLRPLRALDAAGIGYCILSGTADFGGLL